MKKLFGIFAIALFGAALVGCGSKETSTEEEPKPIAGAAGWHLVKWEIGSEDANFPKDVYMIFEEDTDGFTMYQDIDSHGFRKITGTYAFDQETKVLSGTYSDGEAWAYSYSVAGANSMIGTEGQEMTLTATTDADYKLVFRYGDVPKSVIESALEDVRSAVAGVKIL
ncbi:MAG: lipocalin family protein [Alistipes sp.]|nr:lipocalin family protein [Alistipes sp.]